MPHIIGYDTETCEGPPITIQFYSEDLPKITDCIFVNEQNVTQKFLSHLKKHCKHGEFVVYGHNLTFDLLSVFYPVAEQLVSDKDGFLISHKDWRIRGLYDKPVFCILENEHTKISIVDTFSWFTTSLAKLSSMVCPHLPKLKHPEGLGAKRFSKHDDEFVAYAMRDAEVAYHAGKAIDAMHAEFDLRQCVSVADMASKIFRQHYITDLEPIYNTGKDVNTDIMRSYHGGKNNVIAGAAPAWHSHIDAWDLSSAYPWAMTLLPAFSSASLFQFQVRFNPRARHFPEHGIYCISGKTPDCDWPIIFDDKFSPVHGKFENVWTTGYELNEARRAGEISLSRVYGHVYMSDQDPVTDTSFQRYVADFYALKQNANDLVMRHQYKVLLNALYGKLIQLREVEAKDGQPAWKAGPLYHPFAASLITGHTRAIMHRLEHETKAIHTATDGVFCGANNSPTDGFPWAPQTGIGAIESEGRDMELCLLRNKLYILYSEDKSKGFPSFVRKDRNVVKFAKHGFQGGVPDFERCAVGNERRYVTERPNTLRTSLKRGLTPNKFEAKDMVLKVAPIREHYNHSQEEDNHGTSKTKHPHRKK